MSDRELPDLPCACASLRRAARAVTQLYDEELRPSGLRSTQFTLLQALHQGETLTQRRLGALLALDSTTLTRTLRPLEAAGWIHSRIGHDRRERLWALTASGRAHLLRARPLWQRAQQRLQARLSREEWETLPARMAGIAATARRA